eukprot:m.27985 g.27985  ORF g.27985 m.27985 type:complete len:192 (-) comp9004_c0_seq1:2975-3550(-)
MATEDSELASFNAAKMKHLVVAPQRLGPFELSIHKLPRRMRETFTDVFGRDVGQTWESVHVIPTFQSTTVDLVGLGADVEQEKDLCLEQFVAFANLLCKRVNGLGYWADYTDPASGLPALGDRGVGVYPEVQAAQYLFKYDVINTGCCSLLSHPAFGTSVYPATLFSTAPAGVLEEILQQIKEEGVTFAQS